MSISQTASKSSNQETLPVGAHIAHALHIAALRVGTWNREALFDKIVDSVISHKLKGNNKELAENGLDEIARAVRAYRGPLGSGQKHFIPSQKLRESLNRFDLLESLSVDVSLMSIQRNQPTNDILALAVTYVVMMTRKQPPSIANVLLYDKFGYQQCSLLCNACKEIVGKDKQDAATTFAAALKLVSHYTSRNSVPGALPGEEHPAVQKVQETETAVREAKLAALKESAANKKSSSKA